MEPVGGDFATADSRVLHEPFSWHLENRGPRGAFTWLVGVLSTQKPALRSSNCSLVAYTGCPDALDWIETNVGSPVTHQWGDAAALLGAPWPRIASWLSAGGSRQLMALDALLTYRAPAPNMAPLVQIASPVLLDAPGRYELEVRLNEVLRARSNPRVQSAVTGVLKHVDEILTPRSRGVPVADLPKLYLHPEAFPRAGPVLDRHTTVTAGIRQSIQDMLQRNKLN